MNSLERERDALRRLHEARFAREGRELEFSAAQERHVRAVALKAGEPGSHKFAELCRRSENDVTRARVALAESVKTEADAKADLIASELDSRPLLSAPQTSRATFPKPQAKVPNMQHASENIDLRNSVRALGREIEAFARSMADSKEEKLTTEQIKKILQEVIEDDREDKDERRKARGLLAAIEKEEKEAKAAAVYARLSPSQRETLAATNPFRPKGSSHFRQLGASLVAPEAMSQEQARAFVADLAKQGIR